MPSDKPFGLSVRAVIYDKDGRCLLLKRSVRSKNYPGKWEFPGGKVNNGERFDDALLREVREETGLAVKLKRFIGAVNVEMPHVTAIQIVMEVEPAPGHPVISREHEAGTWASPEDMLSMELVDWLAPFVHSYLLDRGG